MGKRKIGLDYHEGLSRNQVYLVLESHGLEHKYDDFCKWLYGQTCPIIERRDKRTGKSVQEAGVYEYDLFRYVANQKKGTPLVFD
jgi:hypothetical protein